jgi:hypothetical protein
MMLLATPATLVYQGTMRKPADPITRKNVNLPNSVWAEVAEFRFAERINTEAEAVRRLVMMGLRVWKPTHPKSRSKGRSKA